MRVLEMVSFELAAGSEEDFVTASAEIDTWVAQQTGFVHRHLAKVDGGAWTDVILWESVEAAQQAAKKIMQEIGDCAAMRMIDPTTVKTTHAAVKAFSS